MNINDLKITDHSVTCKSSKLKNVNYGDLLGYDIRRKHLIIIVDEPINILNEKVLDFIERVTTNDMEFKIILKTL